LLRAKPAKRLIKSC